MIKNRKKILINIILLSGILTVWGFIILHIFQYFNSLNESSDESADEVIESNILTRLKSESLSTASLEWINLDRDPFELLKKEKLTVPVLLQPVHDKQKKNDSTSQPKTPQSTSPASQNIFVLSGIIINNDSKLAILLDDNDKKTIFLHEGEEYNGIVLKEIQMNSITILENAQLRELFIKK